MKIQTVRWWGVQSPDCEVSAVSGTDRLRPCLRSHRACSCTPRKHWRNGLMFATSHYSGTCLERQLLWETTGVLKDLIFLSSLIHITMQLNLLRKTTCLERPYFYGWWGGLSTQVLLCYISVQHIDILINTISGCKPRGTLYKSKFVEPFTETEIYIFFPRFLGTHSMQNELDRWWQCNARGHPVWMCCEAYLHDLWTEWYCHSLFSN